MYVVGNGADEEDKQVDTPGGAHDVEEAEVLRDDHGFTGMGRIRWLFMDWSYGGNFCANVGIMGS